VCGDLILGSWLGWFAKTWKASHEVQSFKNCSQTVDYLLLNTPQLLLNAYFISLSSYVLAFGFHLLRWLRTERWFALIGLGANVAFLVLIHRISGHFPVFNLFESFLMATLVLASLGLTWARSGHTLPDVRTWVYLEILILLAITLLFPKKLSPYLYDHDDPFIILFQGLRVVAMSVMLFSSAQYVQSRIHKKWGLVRNDHGRLGRNFLLLSATLFLAAEYVGIIWCQRGWGDFWMWNEGFFQSTLIVLYLMLAFHLPGRGSRAEGIRSLVGSMSGFVMLSVMVIRSIY
jgi:hypothetical protein